VVEELAAAEEPAPVVQPLAVHDLVAAPRQGDPPHLAAAEAESRPAGRQHMGRVEPGPAAPYLAGVHADSERAALRNPLHRVPAREVHQLVCFGRHRQRETQRADHVRLGGNVGQGGSEADESGGRELDLDDDVQPRDRIRCLGDEPLATVGESLQPLVRRTERCRPVPAGP
jgi:hypothetical protein